MTSMSQVYKESHFSDSSNSTVIDTYVTVTRSPVKRKYVKFNAIKNSRVLKGKRSVNTKLYETLANKSLVATKQRHIDSMNDFISYLYETESEIENLKMRISRLHKSVVIQGHRLLTVRSNLDITND
jgi:hypothetical protein